MSMDTVSRQPSGFTNRVSNVAIVGASGQIGRHIVKELSDASVFRITALTRVDSESKMPEGIHTVRRVDYNDTDSIAQALRGQDVLIATLSATAPRDLPNKLVDAAVEAGVHWYIPNDWGVDLSNKAEAKEQTLIGIGKEQHQEYIKSKGLSYTPIGCGFWYEWSLSGGINMFGIDINSKKARFYGNGMIPQTTSTWAQTARAVSAFLSLPILPLDESDKKLTMTKWKNRYLNIASFNLNQRQMLDAVEKATKTTDLDWDINYVEAEEIWKNGIALLKAGDTSAFPLCLYSRTFFADQPSSFADESDEDMRLLNLSSSESLDEATMTAVGMAKENYVQNFFKKLHATP